MENRPPGVKYVLVFDRSITYGDVTIFTEELSASSRLPPA